MSLTEQQNLAVHIYGETDPDINLYLMIARILTFQLWETVDVTLDVTGQLFNQEVMIRYYWMLYHKVNNAFKEGDDERYFPDPPFGINLSGLVLSACPNCSPIDENCPLLFVPNFS
jgi:hypothetical protein